MTIVLRKIVLLYKIHFPILESFSLEDDLTLNGLLVRTIKGIDTKKFRLKFAINGNTASRALKDQVYIDQREITISNIDIQVAQSQKIYSLLDSVFEVPTIRLKDDPEIPFFNNADKLIFRFNKPPGYKLDFSQANISNNNIYHAQIVDGRNVEIDIIDNLLESVDVIPNSIVLAQAANESGWGTSRFATDYNALFGEYTFDIKSGVVPIYRSEGENYLIKFYHLYITT